MASLFSASITMGMIASTRGSTAPSSQVVHPRFAGEKLLDGIHRAHAALDHREPHEPGVVLGSEVLDASVGDEIVLGSPLLRRICEMQRLVRHHEELGGGCAGFDGHL